MKKAKIVAAVMAVLLVTILSVLPAAGESYAVHLNPMDHGTVIATPEDAHPGERVYLTVVPEQGYMPVLLEVRFSMRDEAPLDPDNSFIMPDEDVVVNATFEKIPAGTYQLITVVQGGHGSVSASRYGMAAGETETIIFMPEDGYQIDKVTVNGTEAGVLANVLDVTVNADTELVVTYKPVGPGFPTEDETDAPTDPTSQGEQPTDPAPTTPSTAPSATPTEPGASQSAGGWMMWTIIGLSAAVVALAAALIILNVRKK